jgi:hypothetical protein
MIKQKGPDLGPLPELLVRIDYKIHENSLREPFGFVALTAVTLLWNWTP